MLVVVYCGFACLPPLFMDTHSFRPHNRYADGNTSQKPRQNTLKMCCIRQNQLETRNQRLPRTQYATRIFKLETRDYWSKPC